MIYLIAYVSHTDKLVNSLIFGRKIKIHFTVHNLVFNGHCTMFIQH